MWLDQFPFNFVRLQLYYVTYDPHYLEISGSEVRVISRGCICLVGAYICVVGAYMVKILYHCFRIFSWVHWHPLIPIYLRSYNG